MYEAILAGVIAIITGSAAITNRLHRRIDEIHSKINTVDRRIDTAELSMARHYVIKTDFEKAFAKMEDHMVRIEDKLDSLVIHRRSSDNYKDG